MSAAPCSVALAEVVKLIKHGYPCFPCSADKRPATPHGFKDATLDPDAAKALWSRHPGPLVGVPTGAASGLDVLDVDGRTGGGHWFATHRGELPVTRVHRTRSGGLHIFFRHHAGVRCSAGQIAPGIDVRADGGYVIWWPAAGCPVLDADEPAQWPAWLLQSKPQGGPLPGRTVVPNDHSLAGLVRTVALAPEGERNRITFWAACRAGEMVASGLLPSERAAAIIAEAAARAGLPAAEARRTAISGIRKTGG
jgi:hypothetical protein